MKLLLAREKAMKPRTYRLSTGSTLFVGGLARFDVDHLTQGSSAYVTVWASDLLPLHAGKTETAQSRWLRFVGNKLYPPSGSEELVQALGPLIPQEVRLLCRPSPPLCSGASQLGCCLCIDQRHCNQISPAVKLAV